MSDTQAASKADVEGGERRLGSEFTDLELRIERRFSKLEADFHVMKWMMGFILAFQVAIFTKLFVH